MKREVIFIFGLLVLFSLTGFVFAQENSNFTNQSNGSLVACPEDAKICENGTVLERDPALNCEFPACSEELVLDCAEQGALCGGIAGISCCGGLDCELEGDFPDASGTCVLQEQEICVDSCGDGVCDEIVCQGEGCPCMETVDSCAVDCSVSDDSEGGISLFWVFVILVVVVFLIIVGLKIAKWLMWAAIIAGCLMLAWYLFL
ncbi:MAG: hypothetical protein KC506_03795 [Nanoarchaeota archaeon]|nr:hypothetical protein [Nanoarchaeota archaeon]